MQSSLQPDTGTLLRLHDRSEVLQMVAGPRKQVDVSRLVSELSNLKIEILSAQSSMDRLRLQYSARDIVTYGEPQTLKRVAASADALYEFVSQIRAQMLLPADEEGKQ